MITITHVCKDFTPQNFSHNISSKFDLKTFSMTIYENGAERYIFLNHSNVCPTTATVNPSI